jgi:hypothetical protein
MKTIILFAFSLITVTANAQCDSIFKFVQDKFTDRKSSETNLIEITNGDESMHWQLSILETFAGQKNVIRFSMIPKVSGLGCISQGSKITFLLNDKSKVEMVNGASFNCDGVASLYFYTSGLGSKQFTKRAESIISSGVSAIRIVMDRTVFDYDFTNVQSKDLQAAFSCAMKKAGK